MSAVREKILEIIKQYVNEDINLEGDISLIDDLEFDSVQLLEVISEIEEAFGLSDDDNLMDLINHLEELIKYVESHC